MRQNDAVALNQLLAIHPIAIMSLWIKFLLETFFKKNDNPRKRPPTVAFADSKNHPPQGG